MSSVGGDETETLDGEVEPVAVVACEVELEGF
jgi:hypothetical protein